MTQQTEAATGYFDDVSEYVPAFEDGTYVLTVVRIEASDGGKFEPGLKWVFNMVNQVTGEKVLVPNSNSGELYEFFQFSSKKITPRTKIYPWLTAFLGRPPAIGESGIELVRLVLGKSAVAYVGVAADDPGGRQRILTIKPVSVIAPRAVQAPVPAPAPVAADDDEDALMAKLEAARARKGAANREKAGVTDEAYRAIFDNQVPA